MVALPQGAAAGIRQTRLPQTPEKFNKSNIATKSSQTPIDSVRTAA